MTTRTWQRRLVGLLVALSLVGAALLVWLPTPDGAQAASEPGSSAASDLSLLLKIYDVINLYYVEPVDGQSLLDGAIDGLLKAVGDPYTEYLSPQEYEQFSSSFEGEFVGVGIQVRKTSAGIKVVAPLPDSPAEEAGIRSGDIVVGVDGERVIGKSLETVVGLIRGRPGTVVQLTLLRQGSTFRVTIRREVIKMPPSVEGSTTGGIGVITISQFERDTAGELAATFERLRQEGARGYVIDLRNNPGGLFSSAVDVADQLLAPGRVVVVQGRDGVRHVYKAEQEPLRQPYVLLVNGGTASAAEIVAAAVQDRTGHPLIGTRTFGKGSVQSLVELGNGGALKVTTAYYLSPEERSIDDRGLTPDIQVQDRDARDLAREVLTQWLQARQQAPRVRQWIQLAPDSRLAWTPFSIKSLRAPLQRRDGSWLVPLRPVMEALGGRVSWDPDTQKVWFSTSRHRGWLQPGAVRFSLDRSSSTLSTPPVIVRGATMVPLSLFYRLDFGRQFDGSGQLTIFNRLRRATGTDG